VSLALIHPRQRAEENLEHEGAMRREGEVCPQAAGEGAELSSEQDSNPAALGQAFHVA